MAAEVVLVVLSLVAFEEAAGVATVGEAFEFAQQAVIKRTACNGIVNRFAVGLGHACNIIERFGTAFDFEAVHTNFCQFLNHFNAAKVFGVHDVGAVFIFHNRHHFARAVGLFNQENFVGVGMAFLTVDAFKVLVGFFLGFFKVETLQKLGIACIAFSGVVNLVVPTAGVGAGALVGVAMVEIAGEQAAAGVGDTQCAVNEDFEFDVGAFLADFGDFFHAQFARQNNALNADVLPEFHAPVVGGVCLYGQVNRHFRPFFAHSHNQTRIRHNQRVGFHGNQGLHIGNKGFEFGVVRQRIDGQEEFFVALVRFFNALLEDVEFGKFVVAGAQGVTRAAGVNGICAVIIGGAHAFEAACR